MWLSLLWNGFLFTIGALLVAIVVDFLLSLRSQGPRAPPVWGGGLPLLTHFIKFAGNPLGTILSGYEAKGSIFTLRLPFGLWNFTFVVGAEAHAPFFNGRDESLSQNEPYKFMTPIFGKGVVFDAPPHVKNQQLKFVAGALRGGALRTYVDKIVAETEAFLADWGDAGEKDLLEELSNLTILTASSCLLGREVRQDLYGQVSHLLRELDEGINPIAILNPYLPLPAFRRRDAARAKFVELFSAVIQRRRGNIGEKPDDMLQAFMDAEYEDGTTCSDDQITGMLLGVLFAGQHTSSITSTWVTLNLLHRPELLSRARAEQAAVLRGPTPEAPQAKLCMDNVQAMNFLHTCMDESLRQAPPLIMLMRKTLVPVDFGKYTIPAGHYVFAPLAVSMNLPDGSPDAVFEHPKTFDPDRFVRKEHLKKPFSYCAFGGGIHGCLGTQFGYLQVKTIVALLLDRFEMEPVAKELPAPNYQAMVVGPMQTDGGCRIRYRLRKPAAATVVA